MNLLARLHKWLWRERRISPPEGEPLFGCVVVEESGRVRIIRFAADDPGCVVDAPARERSQP
jgi:hypothetical protein